MAKAADVRNYLASLEQRLLLPEEEERRRVAAWIKWANEWSKGADPVQNTRMIVGL